MDVFLKPVNGKAQTQKTVHEAWDAFPAISPDGTKLAFASRRNGSFDIFVTNLESGRARQQITSTADEEIAPSWSSDGRRIAYSRLSRTSFEWEVWIYDLDTGSVTSLVPGLFPRYSPVEDLIVFQRPDKQTGYSGLWTIDEQGTKEIQVLGAADESFITPSWSPDGTRIVFASYGKVVPGSVRSRGHSPDGLLEDLLEVRAGDIWTINLDGTGLSQLTTHKANDWDPDWAGDGRIFFSSTRGGTTNIWSVIPEFVDLEGQHTP